MWCGSLVVLVWFQEGQREPQKAEKNPKLKLCGSVKSLYWQGFQRREPQEPQEPTFLFMYRDSSENWPHGSLIRKIPITHFQDVALWWCWLLELSRTSWQLSERGWVKSFQVQVFDTAHLPLMAWLRNENFFLLGGLGACLAVLR